MNPEENSNANVAPVGGVPTNGAPVEPAAQVATPTPEPTTAAELVPTVAPAPITEPAPAADLAPAATGPAPAIEEPAPSLDQVAAELTSAATEGPLTTDAPTPETSSESPLTAEPTAFNPDMAPVMPEAPIAAAPETLAISEAPAIPEAPVTPAATPTMEAPITPEAPVAPATPEMPDIPATMETPVAPAMDTMTAPAQDMPVSSEVPLGAEMTAAPLGTTPVDGAPAATSEEEPPLVPAEPVPGSIGSAISYSDSTPDHSTPTVKPKKSFSLASTLKLSKENMRLVAIIAIGIILVAVVVVVLIFILNGSNKKNTTSTNTGTNNSALTVPTVSSLTCTREGGADAFPAYGEVITGKEEIIAMYSEGYLDSFGTNLSLSYDNEEAARFGEDVAKNQYNQLLSASSLTTDPFDSTYNVINNTLTVTHQGDGDTIDETNARALGLLIVSGKIVDDPDTLVDNYETEGYTCVEK